MAEIYEFEQQPFFGHKNADFDILIFLNTFSM